MGITGQVSRARDAVAEARNADAPWLDLGVRRGSEAEGQMMSMGWTVERPTEAGFYYWQDRSLLAISKDAVRVVQVSKYAHREGFQCHTLTRMGEASPPVFDTTLGHEPAGWWAGPLPQPY